MSVVQLDPGRRWSSAVTRVVWRCVLVAVTVAVVVVTFGYALTGVHNDVLTGAGSGVAIGVGLSLRMGERNGLSVGILVGWAAGILSALVAGLLPGTGLGPIIGPILALAIGLIDGLGTSRLRGYREAGLESLTMAALLGIGLMPALYSISPTIYAYALVFSLCHVPQIALIAGYFNRNREGRRFSRPPAWLILAVLAAVVLAVAVDQIGSESSFWNSVLSVIVSTLVITPAVFLSARAVSVWLQPRLRVYLELTEYLRVMWVPIGGFAIGYLVIILLFAGFYGTLARFSPGSFTGVGDDTGILDWVWLSFFTALARDYPDIVPASAGARALVAFQLLPSIGWALVVFAAVMSSIQPRLERIARRRSQSDRE